jgi:hypothetical protein
LTDEERAALRAAMYGAEDEETEQETQQLDIEHKFDFEVAGKFVTLTVDGKKIDVASARYAHALEKQIEAQDRVILRLKSEQVKLRGLLNKHSNELNDVNRELDRKINMRDLP